MSALAFISINNFTSFFGDVGHTITSWVGKLAVLVAVMCYQEASDDFIQPGCKTKPKGEYKEERKHFSYVLLDTEQK